jgi:hypothetical protein
MNKLFKNAVWAFSIALVLPLFAAAELPQQAKVRKEAIQLTRSIEVASRNIHNEAENLKMAQRNSQISKQSHQMKLHRIALQVNERLKPSFDRLAELQPHLPEWNSAAIDQMRTSAASLAASTNAAIVNRNTSQHGHPAVLDPEYRDLVASMTDHADALVQIADATSDYSDAQLKGHEAGLSIASHN